MKPYQAKLEYIPQLPHHKIQMVFQDADIFVFPSLHEGSALSIYEALACGLPVITTPNAGSVVRNGEEGYIVPIRDVDGLIDKISILYHDRALRESMGKKARIRAEQFTWENYRKELSELMYSVIGKRVA